MSKLATSHMYNRASKQGACAVEMMMHHYNKVQFQASEHFIALHRLSRETQGRVRPHPLGVGNALGEAWIKESLGI